MPDETARGSLVELRGIEKTFGDVRALAGVDVELRAGEIHALLGENGAGKTTLMNVLYGLLQPDAGEIVIDGTAVRLRTSEDAIAYGVGMVHQHFKLVPTLTVAESMLLGRDGGALLRKRDLRAMAERIAELGERYGLHVDPWAKIWHLSVGEQQRVEMLRALDREARVLILDEPTATLTPIETAELFPKLRAMAGAGAAIVLITHHLDEVVDWADRISVLRQGRRVATLPAAQAAAAELARLMVGESASSAKRVAVGMERDQTRRADAFEGRPPMLETTELCAAGDRGVPALDGCDLRVRAGEIVAIAGVEGNGQTELEEVLLGLRAVDRGRIQLAGDDITTTDAGGRLRAGMGLVPSDRYRRGLIGELSVAENLVLDRLDEPPYGSGTRLHHKVVQQRAAAVIDRFGIRVSGPGQLAGTLSGGNAQRVVLARALDRELCCLVAAQPTRGLDVGAVTAVWKLLEQARDDDVAVLVISTDLEEIFALADRCYVMYRGRFVAEWSRAELERERLGLAMGGAADDVPAARTDGQLTAGSA